MADFCAQCAFDMGFDSPDLDGLTSEKDWADGRACAVICEGCGLIQVDPQGRCLGECVSLDDATPHPCPHCIIPTVCHFHANASDE